MQLDRPHNAAQHSEVVPTSDDDDIFFVSQPSDNLASSSASLSRPAHPIRRTDVDNNTEDEDDGDETLLPLRPRPPTDSAFQHSLHPLDTGLLPIADAATAEQLLSSTPAASSRPSTPPLPFDSIEAIPQDHPASSSSSAVHLLNDAGIEESLPTSQVSVASTLPLPSSQLSHPGHHSPPPSESIPSAVANALPTQRSNDDQASSIAAHIPHEAMRSPGNDERGPLSPLAQSASDGPISTPPLSPLRIPSRPAAAQSPTTSRPLPISPVAAETTTVVSPDAHSPVQQGLSLATTPPLSPLRIPSHRAAPRSPPIQAQLDHPQPLESPPSHRIVDDEQVARAAAAQPPTPPRRQLRARNAAQINPYTLEAMRYQRTLIRNDWEDAVVSQREWHRQERKRLAEEAARANRDHPGSDAAEQSQSQWLVPASEPSSQADYEADLQPSSQSVPNAPEVFVELPAPDRGTVGPQAGPSRSRGGSPLSSQQESLPDLADMLGKAARSAVRPAAQTTYKRPRNLVLPSVDSQVTPNTNGSVAVPEQESGGVAVPPPSRRKHPLRALSPSDTEAAGEEAGSSRMQGTVTIESSEDERPVPKQSAPRVRRRSRWSGDGSSSDSTDYERRFRQLKKMMPAGMARKHIRDLRAMRHGKAYHSDGHLSSSSTEARTRAPDRPRPHQPHQLHGSSDDELQPGQTRKRLRRHNSTEHNALLIDPDSDSDSDSESSASTASSGLSRTEPFVPRVRSPSVAEEEEAEEAEEGLAGWWSARRLEARVPFRERDAIDRMLSRTAGRKPSTRPHVRRTNGVSSVHRQARIDGFLSHQGTRPRPAASKRSQLRELDQNRTSVRDANDTGLQRPRKKRKKSKKLDPRIGRTSGPRHRGGAPIELRNPPVVTPRVRPRLDLEHHNVLFARRPVASSTADGDGAEEAADESDGDEQWHVLGSLALDGAAELPDARLARPRTRPAAAPQLQREGEATPVRNALSSPLVSLASGGVSRLHVDAGRSPSTPTRANPHHPHAQPSLVPAQASETKPVDAWDDFDGISLDFGMAALTEGHMVNVAGSELFARLADLIALPERLLRREPAPRTWRGEVLRLDDTLLSMDMDADTLASSLPFFMDSLRIQLGRSLDEPFDAAAGAPARVASKLIGDTGAFLGCWLVRQAEAAVEARRDAAPLFACYRTMLTTIEQLQTSMLTGQREGVGAAKKNRKPVGIQLAWMRFELCWRAVAVCDAEAAYALEPEAPTVESLLAFARALIAVLLHHGLHRSVRAFRAAITQEPDALEESESLDETATMWVGMIHLLDAFERSRGVDEGRLFWTQFEHAQQRWDEWMPARAPLLRAESLWYCLLALPTFSQLAPTGACTSRPVLRECWSAVARALAMLHFRTDEAGELAMGWHVLARRDGYVRVVLQRCCLLVTEWRWRMHGAEPALAKLFDIFNAHKLADLPTETLHDFPVFLRELDATRLAVRLDAEASDDPTFHLFLRLLARAADEVRQLGTAQREPDRRIQRLFSRMTPVRVMPFTRADVPTSAQRSVLFNHYAIVMLLLHLVPSSSAQRLRQMQSFLPTFADADFLSQVSCVRAMMYVAVEFRHHRLDLAPVVRWFGDTVSALRREYEQLDRATQPHDERGASVAPVFAHAPKRQAGLRRKEEVARLLVVALRSIQHVIRHADLCPGGGSERLPDQQLLHPAWTHELLAAQIALEPRIGQEALRCIQTFLLARMQVLHTPSPPKVAAGEAEEESQDSFAELFEADEFDFDDPVLAHLLDGGIASDRPGPGPGMVGKGLREAEERRQWDREFGEVVKGAISPALFQLLSNVYHPDASVVMGLGLTHALGAGDVRMEGLIAAAEARQFLELLVDCWAGCAHVLVVNGLRGWASYLGFGNESWRRIDHAVGRRDVALRFLHNILSLDPDALRPRELQLEAVAVWIQAAAARVLSVQNSYTTQLHAQAQKHHLDLVHALTSRWTIPQPAAEMGLEEFAHARLGLLQETLAWISECDDKGLAYTLLAALLAALRAYVQDTPSEQQTQGYFAFVRQVLHMLEPSVHADSLASLAPQLAQLNLVLQTRTHTPAPNHVLTS